MFSVQWESGSGSMFSRSVQASALVNGEVPLEQPDTSLFEKLTSRIGNGAILLVVESVLDRLDSPRPRLRQMRALAFVLDLNSV